MSGPAETGNDAAMDDIMASMQGGAMRDETPLDPPDPVPAPPPPPVPAGDTSLEAVVRSMLEPMLKQWLDAHLPEIVDRAAQAEIARLTRRDL